MKLTITDIPEGTIKAVLRPEWQYRINGGYTAISFLKEGEEYSEYEYDEIVDGDGDYYQHLYYDGITVGDLAKECFTDEALAEMRNRGIELLGPDNETEEETVHANENSDS